MTVTFFIYPRLTDCIAFATVCATLILKVTARAHAYYRRMDAINGTRLGLVFSGGSV